jgi:hypothetical protein
MTIQTRDKTQHYLDLKVSDRLKFFRGNSLELVLDVDCIKDEGMIIYIKDHEGTRKYSVRPYCNLRLNRYITFYSHGKKNGNRCHCHLEMNRCYEFVRQ